MVHTSDVVRIHFPPNDQCVDGGSMELSRGNSWKCLVNTLSLSNLDCNVKNDAY